MVSFFDINNIIRQMHACCPFDMSHVIDSTKLLRHIQKCKSANRANFHPCPFNQVHWVHFDLIQHHKQECPDRNKRSSLIFAPKEGHDVKEHKKEKIGDSFISEIIPVEPADESSAEIYQLAMDFERHKPPKNEIQRQPRKRINKREMRQLNKDRLWQEPNFADWFDANYDQQQRYRQRGGERENRFLLDDGL